MRYRTPMVIKVADALHQVRATTRAGLAVVAEFWRPVDVRPEMRFDELEQLNQRTLELLKEQGLLADAKDAASAIIRDRWTFPLWPLARPIHEA